MGSDHLELESFGVNGSMKLNVLKSFKDGTYYEDFFAEKALATLRAAVITAGKGDGAKTHLMQVEDPNAVDAGFIGKVQPCDVSIFDVTVE